MLTLLSDQKNSSFRNLLEWLEGWGCSNLVHSCITLLAEERRLYLKFVVYRRDEKFLSTAAVVIYMTRMQAKRIPFYIYVKLRVLFILLDFLFLLSVFVFVLWITCCIFILLLDVSINERKKSLSKLCSLNNCLLRSVLHFHVDRYELLAD